MGFSFIDKLEKSSAKKVYREYEIRMGIDAASVFIPLEKSIIFEEKINKAKPKKRSELRNLVEELGGIIE